MGAGSKGRSPAIPRRELHAEWLSCRMSFGYWCHHWVQVYDPPAGAWVPFHLWPSQVAAARTLQGSRLVVMLKARQLGMSWLATAYGLWLMIFRPASTVLLFSKRDQEATDLLSYRLRGMYDRLPPIMRASGVIVDNTHQLRLSNGSAALAFPTTGGRSYTGNLAVVDEADYVAGGSSGDLEVLLDAVKPTIDAGGQLVLLSTVDKRTPGSAFKRIYQAAKMGGNGYMPVFLPWTARPERDDDWYAAVKQDFVTRSGSLDSLYAEYPATDVEALAPLSTDARFAPEWLSAADDTAGSAEPQFGTVAVVTAELGFGAPRHGAPRHGAPGPALPQLRVYESPRPGRDYVIGADPAEGNPQSDESVACVLDSVTGDQVALWAGRFEPATFAAGLQSLAKWYRREEAAGADPAGCKPSTVGVMIERNNHGHAVLLAFREGGASGVLHGLDKLPGWLTTAKNKAIAVDAAADLLRDGATSGSPPKIRDVETLRQLVAFSGSRLAAPPGDHDDRCMAWCLAAAAARYGGGGTGQYALIPPEFFIDPAETGGW